MLQIVSENIRNENVHYALGFNALCWVSEKTYSRYNSRPACSPKNLITPFLEPVVPVPGAVPGFREFNPAELKRLGDLWRASYNIAWVARQLQRPVATVRKRMIRIGLLQVAPPRPREDEDFGRQFTAHDWDADDDGAWLNRKLRARGDGPEDGPGAER